MSKLDKFYTPLLPLSRGTTFDYEYIRDLQDLVKQNLKNILLTIPGERVMDPDFGVGVSKYLFENFGSFEGELIQSINSQVSKYAPFVTLRDVKLSGDGENTLTVNLTYEIPSLSTEDNLSIGVSEDKISGGPKFLV